MRALNTRPEPIHWDAQIGYLHATELWQRGMNTADIASKLWIPESMIAWWITRYRDHCREVAA